MRSLPTARCRLRRAPPSNRSLCTWSLARSEASRVWCTPTDWRVAVMPKEYDAETKAKAVRLVRDHRQDYAWRV